MTQSVVESAAGETVASYVKDLSAKDQKRRNLLEDRAKGAHLTNKTRSVCSHGRFYYNRNKKKKRQISD